MDAHPADLVVLTVHGRRRGTFKSGSGPANPIGAITVGAGEGPFLLCGADDLTVTIRSMA